MANKINLEVNGDDVTIGARYGTLTVSIFNADVGDIISSLIQSMSDGEILQELDLSAAIDEIGSTKVLDEIDPETIMDYIGFDAFADYFDIELNLKKLEL